jgi:hypothetical protein
MKVAVWRNRAPGWFAVMLAILVVPAMAVEPGGAMRIYAVDQSRAHRAFHQDKVFQSVISSETLPAEIGQRRRDGHMTADERHLLRQHIEDAARDLYKR